MVYHILGKVSQVNDYVAWEEDMLEFICGLHQHMPVLPHLARDLAHPNLHFLVLGLGFADWLVRFFLRVARQSRLSTGLSRVDYLADGPTETLPGSLVMFFGSVIKNIQVVPCDPREFVAELARRWTARHPDGIAPLAATSALPPPDMPRGAIFISYVREDEQAVLQLKGGLEAQGCTVWFDMEQVKSGSQFHDRIQDEVKQNCSLFVSVISRNTESQAEAYFHRERNWAAQRAEGISDLDRGEFYHPVIIDDLDLGTIQREPRPFAGFNRTRLPGGNVTPEFAQRLFALQQKLALQQKHGGASLP